MSDDLKSRVDQFHRLQLPGQPLMMHMGTSYLVNDLWKEIEKLRGHKAKMAEVLEFYKSEWEKWESDETVDGSSGLAPSEALCKDAGDLATSCLKEVEDPSS